jgi:hypothetical protein
MQRCGDTKVAMLCIAAGAGALNHHIGNPAAAAAPAQGLTAPLRPPVSIEGREFQEGELSKDTTTVVLTIEEVEQVRLAERWN